jgi:5'-deoxynucleotidase YfbR-like HD superfamily hydrolase
MSSDNMSTRDVARTLKNAAREGARDGKAAAEERAMAMFAAEEAEGYRSRWDAVQTGFVDEPKRAVQEADALVAQVITRLSEVFADERTRLEQQWGHGDQGSQISTEDLRLALRKYRSFFERLLSL